MHKHCALEVYTILETTSQQNNKLKGFKLNTLNVIERDIYRSLICSLWLVDIKAPVENKSTFDIYSKGKSNLN